MGDQVLNLARAIFSKPIFGAWRLLVSIHWQRDFIGHIMD
jgi:hypothetical protein